MLTSYGMYELNEIKPEGGKDGSGGYGLLGRLLVHNSQGSP